MLFRRYVDIKMKQTTNLTILYCSTSIYLSFRQYYQFPVYTTGLLVTYFAQDMKCGLFLKIDGRALPVGVGACVLDIIPSATSAQIDRQPSTCLETSSVVTQTSPHFTLVDQGLLQKLLTE